MPKTTKPKDDGKTYYDTVRVKMPVPKTTKPNKECDKCGGFNKPRLDERKCDCKTTKLKKKVREWKMFALIDCVWGTIRETGSISFLKCAKQCPTCKIIPVAITEVCGRRKESR